MFWIRCVVVMPSLFFMRTVFGNFRPTTSLDLKRCLPISFSFVGFTSTSLNNFSWHWSKNVDFELQWLLSVLKSIKNGFLVQRWSREWRSPLHTKAKNQHPSINKKKFGIFYTVHQQVTQSPALPQHSRPIDQNLSHYVLLDRNYEWSIVKSSPSIYVLNCAMLLVFWWDIWISYKPMGLNILSEARA